VLWGAQQGEQHEGGGAEQEMRFKNVVTMLLMQHKARRKTDRARACVKICLGFGSKSAWRAVISAKRATCAFTLGTSRSSSRTCRGGPTLQHPRRARRRGHRGAAAGPQATAPARARVRAVRASSTPRSRAGDGWRHR
jgi:hypothetical protein